ncbi:MAG: GNAT family N-acetyltransferase [Proteobacteria bacterium]|nr:GNAT family N-acetyltransferase [Pseudomonadota bacterium]
MGDRRLETERLWLRRIALDDADPMLAVCNDPAFVRNVGDRGVRTLDEARTELQNGALKLFADYGYGPCEPSSSEVFTMPGDEQEVCLYSMTSGRE